MQIAGIDPGLDGAIAVLDRQGVVATTVMPTVKAGKRRLLNGIALRNLLRRDLDHVFLEEPQVVPKKSSALTNLSVGRMFGMIEGILVAEHVPYTLVRPQVWTRQMHAGLPREASTKQRSMIVAQRLFPSIPLLATERSRKPHDGIVDALLIAEWGRRLLNGVR